MIALLLAVLASGSATDANGLGERLGSCATAQTESQAVRCINGKLPITVRKRVLSQRNPLFASDEYRDVIEAIRTGFRLDDDRAPLIRSYRGAGLPVGHRTFDPASYLLETYWLVRKGCRYEAADRVAIEVSTALSFDEVSRLIRDEPDLIWEDGLPDPLLADCTNRGR